MNKPTGERVDGCDGFLSNGIGFNFFKRVPSEDSSEHYLLRKNHILGNPRDEFVDLDDGLLQKALEETRKLKKNDNLDYPSPKLVREEYRDVKNPLLIIYPLKPKEGYVMSNEDGNEPYVCETIETGMVVMEGETERSADDQVYKNRRKIATNGAVFVTLPVDKRGFLKGVPEVSSAGIFETDETGFMKRQIQIEITKAIDGLTKTERKNQDNLYRAVQVASNKVVRASLGADKKPQY